MKKTLAFLLALGVTVAGASAIKVWSAGEVLTATDLNTALAHLHNNLGHGHGAVVVNADISTSAAVSHAKLATPALVPKAWGVVGISGACTVSPCSLDATSGFSGVTRGGTGTYLATLSSARANATYAAFVTSNTGGLYCFASQTSTTTLTIKCYDAAGADTDATFSFQILDNDN